MSKRHHYESSHFPESIDSIDKRIGELKPEHLQDPFVELVNKNTRAVFDGIVPRIKRYIEKLQSNTDKKSTFVIFENILKAHFNDMDHLISKVRNDLSRPHGSNYYSVEEYSNKRDMYLKDLPEDNDGYFHLRDGESKVHIYFNQQEHTPNFTNDTHNISDVLSTSIFDFYNTIIRPFFVGIEGYNGLETEFQEWFDNRADLYTNEVLILYRDYIKLIGYDAIQGLNSEFHAIQAAEHSKKRKFQSPSPVKRPDVSNADKKSMRDQGIQPLNMNFDEYSKFFTPSRPTKDRKVSYLKKNLNSVKKTLWYNKGNLRYYYSTIAKGGYRATRRMNLRNKHKKTRRSRIH